MELTILAQFVLTAIALTFGLLGVWGWVMSYVNHKSNDWLFHDTRADMIPAALFTSLALAAVVGLIVVSL